MKTYNLRIGIFLIINCLILSVISQPTNGFRFRINGNGYTDETVIRLVNGATENFDGSYDAWKLFSINPNVPSIYTQITNGQELSINSLPEFTEDASITIYTNIPTSGNYSIDFEEIFNLTPNYKISLSDISSNTHFRILGDTALSFNFNTQQNFPSFTFNISTPCSISSTNETCFNTNDGSLAVTNLGNSDWDINIYDASNIAVINSTSNLPNSVHTDLLPGSYTAQVISKGIIDEVNFTINQAPNLTADFDTNNDTIYINEGGLLTTTNTSQNAQNYQWNFGDGGVSNLNNPSYNYSMIGDYQIELIASNTSCTVSNIKNITVLQSQSLATSIQKNQEETFSILQLGNGNYQINFKDLDSKKIQIISVNGSTIIDSETKNKKFNFTLTAYSSGIYIVNVLHSNGSFNYKKVIN
ncbi:PKD domain-containing protein [Vicingaceae bacterium]|nr:PKD domain-containing protein [Vicingaceae bacterium]